MIINAFERTAAKNKDKMAVETAKTRITYGQLQAAVHGAAGAILSRNPAPQQTVGILLEHGLEQVTALLAVLKARKIYVPLDSAYPEERLAWMIRDAELGMIVTNNMNMSMAQRLCASIPGKQDIHILQLDEITSENSSKEKLTPEQEEFEDCTAYILYTSGSTGKPKGVVQTCKNVCFYTDAYVKSLSITPADRVTYLSSFSHDGAIQDIYSALFSGAALCPLDIRPGGKFTAADIGKWLIKQKITLYHSVPTVFRYAVTALEQDQVFPHLRLIVTGGEKLHPNDILLARIHFPHVEFAHMYGQTESSVNTMGFIDTKQKTGRITIGEPLQGIKLLLLNPEGEPVEPFEQGEIFVASPHISPGYWKNPEATAKVFLFDEQLGPIYRSGDLGKSGIDGSIEFIGRKDLQVKIRGFRIEPGEIETQLRQHKKIKEALVMDRERKTGEKYLCAYIVAHEPFDLSEARAFLAMTLPDYMVPDYFIHIQGIPVNPNGKVDRNALPEPDLTPAESYQAPQDEIQEKLAGICAEVLSIDKNIIGTNTNFFDLGGNSLNLVSLISKIHQQLGCEVPVTEVFKNPTIKYISHLIKSNEYIEGEVFLLNNLTQRKLFCFPPGIGFGVSYQALASVLPGYTLYAFNFIPHENRIQQYVELIAKLQPEGPYILMGWSAGGRLVFQVTGELERRGHNVPGVILVDSQWNAPIYQDKAFGERETGFINQIEKSMEELGLLFYTDKVKKTMLAYTGYNKEVSHLDLVNAHVHFILSEENRDQEWAWDWKRFTRQSFTLYQGFGGHEDMLMPGPSLDKNAVLIEEILEKIFNKKK
jgi:amino acid adenylation domain-containing protein